jgi:hypothetical protein
MANEALQAAFDFEATPAPIEIPAVPAFDGVAEVMAILAKLDAIDAEGRLMARDRLFAEKYRRCMRDGRVMNVTRVDVLRKTLRWYEAIENEGRN